MLFNGLLRFLKKGNKGEPQKIFLLSQPYNRIIFTRLVFHEKIKLGYIWGTPTERDETEQDSEKKKLINYFRQSKKFHPSPVGVTFLQFSLAHSPLC